MVDDIKLSEHFMLSEFTKSNTAERYNIDNSPSPEIINSLKTLSENVLEKVYAHYGKVNISSGYRCLRLNRLVGSKDTSQHTKGQAVDMEVPGLSNHDLAVWCKSNLNFDQLIMEFTSPTDPFKGWVHCSFVDERTNRHQKLTIDKQGTRTGDF